MTSPADLAQSLPVTIERTALIMRYVLAAVIAPLFLFGYFGGEYFDFFVIVGMTIAHSVYVHILFWARAYHRFFTRTNFLIYLVQISVIIAITGGESSDAYLLYHLLIIGFSAYDRRFFRVFQVTLICLASYILVIVIEYFRFALSLTLGLIVVRLMSTLIVGWMIAALSDRLRRAEVNAADQTAHLVASEATLRAILNGAGDPILVFDDNEYIVEANDRASEFLGLAREQLIGQRFRAYLFDDGTLPHKFADLRARGQATTQEIALPRSGEERVVDLVARSYIRDNARYFIALLRDVTYQRNIEETSRMVEARLEKLNTDLRQLDRHKADFMRAISAGIRTPLSAVSGYVDMLLDGDLGDVNPEQSKALQTCRRGLHRVFRLIEQTIDAYAPRFGGVPQNKEQPTESMPHRSGSESE